MPHPRIPLDLYVEVATSDGTRYRWEPDAAPGDRPLSVSFRTKLGEGFSDGGLTLPRRIDLDYPDLNLVDSVTLVGADGSVAYEGRISAIPRELSDRHSIGVQLVGWMAHARGRRFTEIFVDRDQGAWQDMSAKRRGVLLTASWVQLNGPEQRNDATDSTATVVTRLSGAWIAGFLPVSEAWYDAGDNRVGKIVYSWKRETPATVDPAANWSWTVAVSSDNAATTIATAGNLKAAGPVSNATFTPSARYRWALLQFYFGTAPGGSDSSEFSLAWSKLAVYGDHGLTTYTGQPGEPPGVLASDVIRNIASRFCPKLATGGVQDTTYVIQHLAFKDPVYPYDAFLEVNRYHLWHLGVWENQTLHFRPFDFADYQWEVRTDDPGTTFQFEGPSTGTLFNGIAVTYPDLQTGTQIRLTPDGFSELRDDSLENPWNRWGEKQWDELTLSSPTLQAQALDIGRVALADRNRPKRVSQISVRGYIRDRAGNQQPGWKVRAGDLVVVSSYPADQPRLIHETTWDADSKTLTLSIDAPASTLDAVLDRVANALQARGLSS